MDQSKETALLKGVGPREVRNAALYMRDAIDGADRIHPREGPKYREAYLIHLKVVYFLPFWSILGLILHLYERPLWCARWAADPALSSRIALPCEHEWYPSYPVTYLSLQWNFLFEFVLFIPLAAHSFLLHYAHGPDFWKRALLKARAVVVAAYVLDMIYAYSTPVTYFRLAPYLRVVFVVLYSIEMRQRLQLVVRTLPEVLSIFTVCLAFLTFFSWIGILLFPNEGPDSEGTMYFKNLGVGMWSLYILMTTANFPDVMMPAYDQCRWVVLFFVFFCVISCFFLMNVLTAAVFNEFTRQRQEFLEFVAQNYKENFRKAWDILSVGEGKKARVPKEIILAVYEEFNYNHEIRYIEADEAERKFNHLDKNHSGSLSLDQFRKLGHELSENIKEKKANPDPFLERTFPGLKRSTQWNKLREFLKGGNFDRCVDLVLVINAVLLVLQTWDTIKGDDNEEDQEADSRKGQFAEDIITTFYFCEAALKILVRGWTNYINEPKNRFDFIVTFFTTATAIYVWIPNDYNSHALVRYISILRVLRILRLFTRFGPFRMVAGTFILMFPQAVALAKVLIVVLYVFAIIGVQFFGEVINKDPESKYGQRLVGGDFAEASYYANNFNDLFSGMATLFELLVVNNWFVLADGFAEACDSVWPYAYFVVFHVLSVCCCLNIVVSFIIDSFVEEYGKNAKQSEDGMLSNCLVKLGLRDKVEQAESNVGAEQAATNTSKVSAMLAATVAKLQRQLTTERTKSGSKPAELDQNGESPESKLFKSFLEALDWDNTGDEPGQEELNKALEEAIPRMFKLDFEEGLALLAPFAMALLQHSLEKQKQAEEMACLDSKDMPEDL